MLDLTKPVLVLGASGETGQRVVKALQAKNIPVRAMIRSADKTEVVQGPGVEVLVASALELADLEKALHGVEVIISAMGARGTNDLAERERIEHYYVATLVQAAQAAEIKQIVLCTSVGTTNPEAIPFLTPILYAKRRGEVILEQSGLPYTIVRPVGLINDPGGSGVAVYETIQQPNRISRDDVAEVMVQAILQPKALNRAIEITNEAGAGPANRPDLFG